MSRSLRIGLTAGLASLVIAAIAFGQAVTPFAYPVAPNGTPPGYVPITANTLGQATWGLLDAGASIGPGAAGQVLNTNATPATQWAFPAVVPVTTAYGAKCDGSTNDATAFTNCLAASAANGFACYVPFSATSCVISTAPTIAAGSRLIAAVGVTFSGASAAILSNLASPEATVTTGTVPSPTDTKLWSVQPIDTNKAPFKAYMHPQNFSGTIDDVYFWGYNTDDGNNSEPIARWAIEQDYNDGSGDDKVEAYLETYIAGQSHQNRPYFTSLDRVKATSYSMLQWQNATDASALGAVYFNNIAGGAGSFALFDDQGAFWANPVHQFTSAVVAPTWSQAQAANASAPQPFTLQAQYPGAACTSGANCTPGNVNLGVGPIGATGSPKEGQVNLVRNGVITASLQPYPGAPTAAMLTLSTGTSGTNASTSSFALYGDSGQTIINGPGGTVGIWSAGGSVCTVTNPSSTTTFTIPASQSGGANITQSAATSDVAPADIQLSAQAPFSTATGAHRNPGNVDAVLGAPTNSGTTEGALQVVRTGQGTIAAIGPDPGAPSIAALWLNGTATASQANRTSGNWNMLGDGAGNTYVGAVGSNVYMTVGGTTSVDVTSAAMSPNSFGGTSAGTASLPWGPAYFGANTSYSPGYEAFGTPIGDTGGGQRGQCFRDVIEKNTTDTAGHTINILWPDGSELPSNHTANVTLNTTARDTTTLGNITGGGEVKYNCLNNAGTVTCGAAFGNVSGFGGTSCSVANPTVTGSTTHMVVTYTSCAANNVSWMSEVTVCAN